MWCGMFLSHIYLLFLYFSFFLIPSIFMYSFLHSFFSFFLVLICVLMMHYKLRQDHFALEKDKVNKNLTTISY